MSAESKKRLAAEAALAFVPDNEVDRRRHRLHRELLHRCAGCAQSARSRVPYRAPRAPRARLKQHGIEVLDLNAVGDFDLYVDGADEADPKLHLIKGGGAALTREKIVAAVARRFVCIVDDSKLVPVLGRFPLPVEVIPMARSYVARELVRLGGHPVYREGVVTDNGNQILDVHGLKITDPVALEQTINQIVGVVTVGLFARRPADVLLVARDSGIETIKR